MLRSSRSLLQNSKTEIKIPVPWGHISGIHWPKLSCEEANTNAKFSRIDKSLPVLTFHGWLDNAGSFDKIIPEIQKSHPDLEFYCFDWPGHGLSSHRPAGTYIQNTAYLYDISRILKHLNLAEINTMGHSMGGQAITQFSCVFPGVIKSSIIFDSLGFIPARSTGLAESLKSAITSSLIIDDKIDKSDSKQTKLKYEELKARFLKGSRGLPHTVSPEMADVMLKRAVIQDIENPELYSWTRDLKVIAPSMPTYTFDGMIQFLKSLNENKENYPDVIRLMSNDNAWWALNLKNTPDNEKKELVDRTRFQFDAYNENPKLSWHVMDGNHHFHLNNYKETAKFVNDWIDGIEIGNEMNVDMYLDTIVKNTKFGDSKKVDSSQLPL